MASQQPSIQYITQSVTHKYITHIQYYRANIHDPHSHLDQQGKLWTTIQQGKEADYGL